jgi:hypothetical protein
MVRADVCRRSVATRRAIEHAAQPHAIHGAALHAKAHDATRAVVHYDEHPVGAQDGRFAAKQIETPQTVLGVSKSHQPGRPRQVWSWIRPHGENAPHDVLVDGNAEGQADLLSDAWTTPGRIPPFHVDDCGDEVRGESPGPRFPSYRSENNRRYFRFVTLDGVLTALTVSRRLRNGSNGSGASRAHTRRRPRDQSSGGWVNAAATDSGSAVGA